MSGNEIVLIAFPYRSKTIYGLVEDLERILTNIGPVITISGRGLAGRTSSKGKRILLSFDVAELKPRRKLIVHYAEWILLFVLIQLEMSIRLFQKRRSVKTALFFLGTNYALPILIAKIAGIKSILIPGGSPILSTSKSSRLHKIFSRCLDKIVVSLADIVGLEHEAEIETFARVHPDSRFKLCPLAARFIDTVTFRPLIPFAKRPVEIGFVGRLIPSKGFEEFLSTIPLLVNELPNVRLTIAGEGPLLENALGVAHLYSTKANIRVLGWVMRDKLPELMSGMRLLITPSYSEGLPTVLLEAMACGTPCLCSPVGAIPGIIQDGINGFILENRNPDFIARKAKEIILNMVSDEISERARQTILDKYSMEAAAQRYRILLHLCSAKSPSPS